MSVEALAEWLRRRGHRVARVDGSYWYDAGARIFQPLPFHGLVQADEAELRALMGELGALGLRFSTPPTAPSGLVSYHVVFDDPAYTIESLGARTRNKVRRALRECAVEPIALGRLADEGWPLQQDTLARQGRLASMDRAEWRRLCEAAEGLPGFEAWGATVDGVLAASYLVARVEDSYHILTAQSHRDYFDRYVNNALCFTVSAELRARPGVGLIFYSTHSLDAPDSVDEFKFLMGYRARPVRQRVRFHPLAAPLFNRATHALTRRLLRASDGHPTLSKAEGLIRFYLEGQRPAHSQPRPAVLAREFADEQATV
jgi:hypothetical protein